MPDCSFKPGDIVTLDETKPINHNKRVEYLIKSLRGKILKIKTVQHNGKTLSFYDNIWFYKAARFKKAIPKVKIDGKYENLFI